ncbi:hypothetical protein DPMN_111767 [Dreissena polymorpha]|uniref:Uncharacterized protein n=1 Tax=Dreissena polymorpha TaxID=45954 RepID=A0A9D4KF61_DREPO|nr:hypothetical protein DPMN_111767 [Dreissena polymorpha]
MAEASKSTMSVPAKTEGEMRRSKCVRQPSKRMLYSQDTDSDSSLQKNAHNTREWKIKFAVGWSQNYAQVTDLR